MPKIAVTTGGAFTVNTKALKSGSISLVELARGITLLKAVSQIRNVSTQDIKDENCISKEIEKIEMNRSLI